MKNTMKLQALAALLILSLVLLGAAPAPVQGHTVSPKTTPTPHEAVEGAIVEVKDVDGLLAAIGSNANIALLPGTYELAAAATYGKDTGNPYCRWEHSSEQGYELQITGVENLTLCGAGMDKTTLLAEDRYANVLSFNGCQNVTVSVLTAGHSLAPGYCSGGVLYFTNCTDVTVEGCGLFGCGSMGVWALNCSDMTVVNSRIYECSDMAVYTDGCRNVLVEDCEIDHNGWQNESTGASCLFQAYSGTGFTVTGCRVHDNTANLLLQCGYTRSAAFLSNRVEYNTLQSVFAFFQYPVTVDGCDFHGNYIFNWYAEGYNTPSLAAQDAAGKELTEDDFVAMDIRPVQLPGSEEIVLQEPTEVAPGGEIVVTTVDDFLAAIGPDRTIVLDGASFCLADASDYGSGEGWYYHWDMCYDGPQLIVTGVSNLAIRSAAKDPTATTLTATPRYADVLCFQSSDNVRLSGLTLGHTEGPSDCSGAVLDFENCNGVVLDGCRLYGCGTLGVNAYTCSELQLTDCEIYDCSIGGVTLFTVYGAAFQNCRIHDVPSPAVSLYDCYEVTWNGTVVPGNHYDVTPGGELVSVVLS